MKGHNTIVRSGSKPIIVNNIINGQLHSEDKIKRRMLSSSKGTNSKSNLTKGRVTLLPDTNAISVANPNQNCEYKIKDLRNLKYSDSPEIFDLSNFKQLLLPVNICDDTRLNFKKENSDPDSPRSSLHIERVSVPLYLNKYPPSFTLSDYEIYTMSSIDAIDMYNGNRYGELSTSSNGVPSDEVILEKIRITKWGAMLSHFNNVKSTLKFKERVRKGIPDFYRGQVWYKLSGGESFAKINEKLYENLLNKHWSSIPNDITRMGGCIDRDLNRSFCNATLFKLRNGFGQQLLKRILIAFAMYDPKIGYTQGMNFIAGLLLLYMPESHVFYTLCSLFSSDTFRFRSLFDDNFVLFHEFIFILNKLVEDCLPQLSKYFKEVEFDLTLFVPEWIITVFSRSHQFKFVVRVWDSFFLEGWKVIYRICIAILKYYENELMNKRTDEILEIIREIPSRIETDSILNIAYGLSLSHTIIDQYKQDYDNSLH